MTNAEKPTAYVIPCLDVDAAAALLCRELGLRIDAIRPADDPARVELSGRGLRLVLDRDAAADPRVLERFLEQTRARPRADTGAALEPPPGTRIEVRSPEVPVESPRFPAELVIQPVQDDSCWQTGRAGMLYRDLIPGRLGGAVIASHIRIPEAGPVPDYVHYHRVHFQMIHCLAGWVRVVYEDQGPPFVLEPGDCVLQPPGIRHRVLECSSGLEVLELGCPADHETRVEHDLTLPTDALRPEREFDGQRFLRHRASEAVWEETARPGWRVRDTGMADATAGLADVRALQRTQAPEPQAVSHDADFLFAFVTRGAARLEIEGLSARELSAGDAVVLPPGVPCRWRTTGPDLHLLEVVLPAGRKRPLAT